MTRWEDGFKAGWGAALGYSPEVVEQLPMTPKVRKAQSAAKKRRGKKNPKLSRAMKKAYARSHTKSGRFRKGWDRSRMLKYAHKIK